MTEATSDVPPNGDVRRVDNAITGLSDAEAAARRERGEGNDFQVGGSRSYVDIVRSNLFSFFNNLLFVIGAALIALGRFYDAMTSVGLALVNAVISTAQEMYAKRQLDHIALLMRPTVTLLRGGSERTADPSEIVQGDILRIQPGDQIVVDCVVVGDGSFEVDESLLTGESDPVRKREGDSLLSASFCVSGSGYCRAEKVGRDSYANQLTASARQFVLSKTPLQEQIDFAVRVIMLVVALMSGIILVAAILENATTLRVVQLAAVLSGQVPYGLFFVIVVAYALGAAAIARQGALIQQINAVESLSNVDVLCTDKTGTLTANRLKFQEFVPAESIGSDDLAHLVARFVHSSGDQGGTITALRAATTGSAAAVAGSIPFSSARKWSALSFSDDGTPGTFVLGAFEMLSAAVDPKFAGEASRLEKKLTDLTADGRRVLLFARGTDLHAIVSADAPALPPLEPLGLVTLTDELRPRAAETLAAFTALGIRMKVISGDDPRAVAAVARSAGMTGELPMVTGTELEGLSDEAFSQAAEDAAILGRVSPGQKEQLVAALIKRGHRVAMIGDGVNDVLALKKAQLGIAMQSGSPAARGIADIVLVGDSYGALLPAFDRGKRIVGGMTTVMSLFLARVTASILMIIAITMLGLTFPFEPAQVATSLFTVGIPALLLAAWAKPTDHAASDLLPRLIRFVIPSAVLTMIIGTAIYTFQYNRVLNAVANVDIPQRVIDMFERTTGVDYSSGDAFAGAAATIVAQSTLSDFIAYSAFILILFVEPPIRFFAGWRPVSDDRRPAYLTLALAVVFFVIAQVGPLASYFALVPLAPGMLVGVAVALVVWTLALREVWRRNWLERFLGLAAEASPKQQPEGGRT